MSLLSDACSTMIHPAFTIGLERGVRSRPRLTGLLALALLGSACGGGGKGPDITLTPPTPTRIDVTPAAVTLDVGGSQQLGATVYDQNGQTMFAQTPVWSSLNTGVVSVTASGFATAVGAGATKVSATVGAAIGTASFTVNQPVDVIPSQTFQTIVGWEGTGSIGEVECNQTAFQNYKVTVLNRLSGELGVNRVRLQVRSGYESPVDYFQQFRSGQIDYATWQATWYTPVNDNANPNVTDPSKFQWGWLDYQIDEVVLPLMQRLQARGEKLYVNLNYIDFKQNKLKNFIPEKQPAEYAEFVLAAFQHITQKYGWSPDALEILLEPQNAGDVNTTVTGADLGAAIVAAGSRLASAGYHPDIIAPSDASMANSIALYDAMIQTPGVLQYLKEFSYHRYQGVSLANLQAIAQRGQRDRVRTSMLEWNQGVSIETLLEDLTVGNVSAWQQFSMAFCSNNTDATRTGIYYQINQSNPGNPIVTTTNNARDYRQIFNYVRAGAVRIGAASGNAQLLSPVAFRNADGRYVAVVRTQAAATFALRGLPAGTYGVNYGVQQPFNVDLPDVVVVAGVPISVGIPAKGVITLYQR
ncbi:MAG: hypothetical protein MNPFHGCM_02086 [Gemmatimonadaceae bacterium]|nr:hypothetical protein [Gemmatimonadaceae bacterium]